MNRHRMLVQVSNVFSHYQRAVTEELARQSDGAVYFIQLEEITEELRRLGWEHLAASQVIDYREDKTRAEAAIRAADILILGQTPPRMVRRLLRERGEERLTFAYHERPCKKGGQPWHFLSRRMKYRWMYGGHEGLRLLCASSYASADFSRMGLFRGRCYQWGYMPAFRRQDRDALISRKEPGSIVWAGRYLSWKHPEVPVAVAKELRRRGSHFLLRMIGSGELEPLIRAQVDREGLGDCVQVMGSMPPERVREQMEASEVFLFPSDRNEGWGVVLNEAMNSACAPVACAEIGSVPYLLRNGHNGIIYEKNEIGDIADKVERLLVDGEERRRIQSNAYETIACAWNPEEGARRFLRLTAGLLGDAELPRYEDGPCSEAPIVVDGWFHG